MFQVVAFVFYPAIRTLLDTFLTPITGIIPCQHAPSLEQHRSTGLRFDCLAGVAGQRTRGLFQHRMTVVLPSPACAVVACLCACTAAKVCQNFRAAWRLVTSNEKVLLLGIIQSCFESAMYIFVFLWTPALEANLAEGESVLLCTLMFDC